MSIPPAIVDLLAADPRPSFVVTLSPPAPPSAGSSPTSTPVDESSSREPPLLASSSDVTYLNPALKAWPLASTITSRLSESHPDFWTWITLGQQPPRQKDSSSIGGPDSGHHHPSPTTLQYLRRLWTRTCVQQRFVVVSANDVVPAAAAGAPASDADADYSRQQQQQQPPQRRPSSSPRPRRSSIGGGPRGSSPRPTSPASSSSSLRRSSGARPGPSTTAMTRKVVLRHDNAAAAAARSRSASVADVASSLPHPLPTRTSLLRASTTADGAWSLPSSSSSSSSSASSSSPSSAVVGHVGGQQGGGGGVATTKAATPTAVPPPVLPSQSGEPFLEVINSVDWAATALGPAVGWPPILQQNFNQIVADSRPMALYWRTTTGRRSSRSGKVDGDDYTVLYNEAFSKFCGARHPALLGRSLDEAWPGDRGRLLRETMAAARARQRAGPDEEWPLFVPKVTTTTVEQGHPDADPGEVAPEEIYLKWSLIPLVDQAAGAGGGSGDVVPGFVHPVAETTSSRLWERRMQMLISLGEQLVTARGVKSYWTKAIEELGAVNPSYDIPLAIFYSVEDDVEEGAATETKYDCFKACSLEGSLGVPEGHPIIPPYLQLKHSEEGLSAKFREAMRASQPMMLQTSDNTMPTELLEGLQWRGFGDACRAAVVLPIRPTREENVMGLLFLGLNPRRPFDNDYQQYISLLNQKLTTSLASTVLLEEEARRGMNAAQKAAYDQMRLVEELEAQTKEATESTQKFEAVAEFVPVGMCFGDNHGNITFANDAWYRITGHDKGPVASDSFLSCVLDEDRPNIVRAYNDLQNSRAVTFEFRVKKKQLRGGKNGSDGDEGADEGEGYDRRLSSAGSSPSFERPGLDFYSIDPRLDRHVLASAKAERAPDGTIIRVLTCLTDVTTHKQTAEEAVRRAQQAENLKRMAELATVGMYDMNLEGRLMGANNVFYEMCGLAKVDPAQVVVKPWQQCVVDQDLPRLQESLTRLVREGTPQTAEIRLKTPFSALVSSGQMVVAPRWALATFMPVKSSEGVIQSFTGCLSDVSLQRWQLEKETLRKDEAIESKRQQENFIDMTSHEMRNPLSAIIHCADAVIDSLTKAQAAMRALTGVYKEREGAREEGEKAEVKVQDDGDVEASKEKAPSPHEDGDVSEFLQATSKWVDESIENAETIMACSQHQKRIVDDILTMSKLDSKLLAVTPITVNPIQEVSEALKMFDVEARRVDICLSMAVDKSYTDLAIDFLDLDPSRLKQVLINLLTNALKFTKKGPTRAVSVTISASKTRPTDASSGVQFIPRESGAQSFLGAVMTAANNSAAPPGAFATPSLSSDSSPTPNASVILARHSRSGSSSSSSNNNNNTAGPKMSTTKTKTTAAAAAAAATAHGDDAVFLLFAVKDTGRGLSEQEKATLFQRFVQASSRTHVKYGGSGLGLFISRRLTELQHGAIGVASSPGVGSTFAFYIEAAMPSEPALAEARALAREAAASAVAVAAHSVPTTPAAAATPMGAEHQARHAPRHHHQQHLAVAAAAGTTTTVAADATVARTTTAADEGTYFGLSSGAGKGRLAGGLLGPGGLLLGTIPRANSDSILVRMPAAPGALAKVAAGLGGGGKGMRKKGAAAALGGGLLVGGGGSNSGIQGVLIVEDNLINQQITKRALMDRGFTVDVANHGAEGLDKIMLTDRWRGGDEGWDGPDDPAGAKGGVPAAKTYPRKRPAQTSITTAAAPPRLPLSIVLMDIEMPVQDGLTCTRHIRRLERAGKLRGHTPIVAVSANARAEQVQEARAAGCDDVLVKPYRMPELIERMVAVVGRIRTEEAERDAAARGAAEGEGAGRGDGGGVVERTGNAVGEADGIGGVDGPADDDASRDKDDRDRDRERDRLGVGDTVVGISQAVNPGRMLGRVVGVEG